MEVPASLISKVHSSFSDGLHFAAPLPSLSTSEIELVKGALHICQGFSSDLFYWDHIGQSFRVKTGIYVSHLTRTSLYGILDQFTYAATCLKLVEILVNKIHKSARSPPPTLRAFACSVSAWLKKLRDVALREEENISTGDGKMIATLLGLSSSLSSLCSGAEYLLQIVHEAVPGAYFEPNSYIAAADVAVYILNQLYRKLDEVCLVQGGEEDAYRMLLYIFTGSLLPYVEGLDSWLFEGTLDDPFEEEDLHISEFLPFEKNSTLPSRILSWMQSAEPKVTPLPVVILQECLIAYIKKQADYIGRIILSKLLYDWRLLDELEVLRAIYLLGSGDLLQHFLVVIFNKLDKGESLDDDFELNTILQESIRNSADGSLLSTPDSLVVSITKNSDLSEDEQHGASIQISTPRKSRLQTMGIDVLQSLNFTYKVSWPLELLANVEALKKYNQVMIFLLKVKRAKFVLDKARRWMWKDRSTATTTRKRHWLLEQKLLHFVNAFHQYVMDRVYHSAWRELCEGVAAARSLDEVIEVHESYLLSIQRQCFVVPDKLWALIASRINNILGLALDFYSIQQTLSSGGAVSAIKTRCEMEVDRIERQFDECIAFLLRILSFKLNVGQFPHLADLVTRINYNYFYMSDSGSLMTTSGSDVITSR
ncbi:gamma-tubulin complex component 5 isoform X2 [Coffea eugenioides]|uniref:gamma-tubulin complex component 5 isoform X2 n=1 Tax=Coffea eugenioides TaxID=49369 RepID=UPI000F604FF5|nr:gamma-tubulin complex component 5 isoform X2 [Coffea eugenioides]